MTNTSFPAAARSSVPRLVSALVILGLVAACSHTAPTPTTSSSIEDAVLDPDPESPSHEDEGYADGVRYEFARGVTFDLARARAAYARACERGEARACAAWAHALTIGPPAGRDPARATQLARRACEAGSERGCLEVVFASIAARHEPRPTRADLRAALERACVAGEPVGCSLLGSSRLAEHERDFRDGIESEERRDDEARAVRELTSACDADEAHACGVLASSVGSGRGTPRDDRRVDGLLERSCELAEFASCVVLVQRSGERRDAEPDLERDVARLARACAGGVGDACGLLAGMYRYGAGVARDEARGFGLVEFVCSTIPDRCTAIGRDYVCENSASFDAERSASLLARACEAGEPSACGRRSLGRCIPASEIEQGHGSSA